MGPGGAASGRLGQPVAVQLISLVMAGWVITLAVTAAVVLLLPLPQQPAYRLSELVAAVSGGSLATRDGRTLLRVRQADPPPRGEARVSSPIYTFILASALNLPATQVRLERYPVADPVRRALLRALRASPPRSLGPPGGMSAPVYGAAMGQDDDQRRPPPPRATSASHTSGMKDLPRKYRFFQGGSLALDSFPPLNGEFSLAVREPGGGWLVIKPAAADYPDPWQVRFILWFLACFGLLAPIGFIFARRFAKPIHQFAQAAERLGRDPNAPSIEPSGPAELGRAAEAFNEMQARLRRYVEQRTSAISAVAHDLRTPLARISFKIEALPAKVREPIRRDIVQMEQMLAATLAFVKEASQVRPRERVDLGSALECAVDNASMLGSDVRITSAETLVLEADSLGLERLFTNLIDNAVRYGKRARVRLFRDGDAAVVEVTDSGPGLAEADLEKAFDPFYRVEPSRSPDTGGMGLGLAVARSIARAHGGDITLANGRQGLRANVRLPLPRETPVVGREAARAAV